MSTPSVSWSKYPPQAERPALIYTISRVNGNDSVSTIDILDEEIPAFLLDLVKCQREAHQ